MKTKLRILHIEDDPADAELLELALAEAGFHIHIRRITSKTELIACLKEGWDVVIADYALPGFGAIEALRVMREQHRDVPFVVVSGCIGEEAAVELMKQGAVDCVRKSNLARMEPAISRALEETENRSARYRAERELERRANYDEISGLPNRRGFKDRLEMLLDSSSDVPGVIALRCERLEMIEDTLGKGIGEALLQEVAIRLRRCVPQKVILGQIGPADFVMAVPGEQCSEDWEGFARRIGSMFEQPFVVGGRELFLTTTMGICRSVEEGPVAENLLRGAKAAVHQARAKDIDVAWHTREMARESHKWLSLHTRLRGALERDEFELHYQPKVALNDPTDVGVEALLRWRDHELGLVPPVDFIPVAEQSGGIVAIGKWVLQQACRQIAAWRRQGLGLVRVAVNVSVRQLRDPGFIQVIRETLAQTRIPPSALELEITESDIMFDTELAVSLLSNVRAMGIHISIDDFGTGYSSLAYLKKLPLSSLKIDRSFIVDIPGDADSRAIVEAIIHLAHALGLTVIAEGVEVNKQKEFLLDLACDQAQGYLFSRPLDLKSATSYLIEQRARSPIGRPSVAANAQ